MEHALACFDRLINLPVYVLCTHKVLCHILQKLILEEFESDTERFAPW